MRMLFVDKEKAVLETLYPLLARRNGAEYRCCLSAQEAIRVLKEGFVPDFLFVEYETPPGNGMDVILFLQTVPGGEKVRVLMTTEMADYKKVEALAETLQVAFERKPLQLLVLQRFVDANRPVG